MDAHIRIFFENMAVNAKKAVALSDPKLTHAILVNLANVLPSYIEKAEHDAYHTEEDSFKFGKIRKAMK